VETDRNDVQTRHAYDRHCRETRVWRPGGLWRDFEYNGFGDPTGQHVRVSRPHPSGAGEIAGRRYFDGLGRVWEERASGPDAAGGGPGEPIVVSREFDARGNLQRETLPRYGEAAPVHARTFRYDGLDRLIRAENPDGTTKSFVHGVALGAALLRRAGRSLYLLAALLLVGAGVYL
jgi:YD repeat-containing protein